MSKPVEKPQWVRIAEQFEQSGLTQKQFAQQQGLTLSTVQSWIYRRRRQASRSPVPPVRLLPVEVSSTPVPDMRGLEIVTPRGVRLRVPAGTDVDYVAGLVAALGRAAC
jgi:hypothetical protein